jgi:hypothetical protein
MIRRQYLGQTRKLRQHECTTAKKRDGRQRSSNRPDDLCLEEKGTVHQRKNAMDADS